MWKPAPALPLALPLIFATPPETAAQAPARLPRIVWLATGATPVIEPMKTMPAGEFKARCLRVMDEVQEKRVAVLITKKGRPVAKLVPPDEDGADVFGCLRGVLEIIGNVESAVASPREWRAYGGRRR